MLSPEIRLTPTTGHTPGHVVFHHAESQLAIVGERPVQETEGRVYQQLEIDFGPFRFQPSEFGKLLLVLFLAAFLADRGKRIYERRTTLTAVGLAAQRRRQLGKGAVIADRGLVQREIGRRGIAGHRQPRRLAFVIP